MKRMQGTGPTRRKVLVGIATAGCVTIMGKAAAAAVGTRAHPTFVEYLRTLLASPTGHDAQLVRLARLIVYREDRDCSARRWSDAELSRTVRANIATDHANGRIVDANRWQISATEAHALELMERLRTQRMQAQT